MKQTVTCEEIRKQTDTVHATCRPIMNIPKPTPKAPEPAKEEPAPTASGEDPAAAGTAETEGKGDDVPESVS